MFTWISRRERRWRGPPRVQIGQKFRGSAVESRITQLFGDALKFDFSPYKRSIDLVFVDAAHDYPHGWADSRTALRLVKPGGVVLWHDFTPYFPGLVHGIIEATSGLPLKRLGVNTTFQVVTRRARKHACREKSPPFGRFWSNPLKNLSNGPIGGVNQSRRRF